MKKKWLSVFIAVCVFSVLPSVVSCQCVDANCDSAPHSVQTNVPQCHHAAVSAKARGSSGKFESGMRDL